MNLDQVPHNNDEVGRNTASECSDSEVSEIIILLGDSEEDEDITLSSESDHFDLGSVDLPDSTAPAIVSARCTKQDMADDHFSA